MIMKLCFFAIMCSAAFAAEKVEDKTPKILDSHLAEYYRADAAMVRLQATMSEVQNKMKEAQTDLQTAAQTIQKDCGDKFVPNQDQANPKVVTCIAKPAPPPPPAPAKTEKK